MEDDIIEFLQQSNYIENEPSLQALDDAVKAWKYIIKQPKLTEKNILKIHKILMKTRDIYPELIGVWRYPVGNLTGNVSVGGKKKLAWQFVPNAMIQWIINANDLVINGKNENAQFLETKIKEQHIKLLEIHGFIDGNGRTSRIIMNWQRIKLNLSILVIREEDKFEYFKWFNSK